MNNPARHSGPMYPVISRPCCPVWVAFGASQQAIDDPAAELGRQRGEARPAVVEPRPQCIGRRVAGETFEPDRPCAARAPGRGGAGDDDVAAVALVQALGQGQPRDAPGLQAP
ncbi:hypothetical protein [Promicromonospora sp. NPDC019610]|uniref:hypothetical protein n=1 Tax=Promicromonospora sp. NPDC019610 TaxID=3364405 RepID=UPI0037965AE0